MEDTIDDVALTSYYRLECAFNVEGWQEEPQRTLLHFLGYCLSQTTAARSTDSSPEGVILSVPRQFQLLYRRGNASASSYGPTLSNAEFQGMCNGMTNHDR